MERNCLQISPPEEKVQDVREGQGRMTSWMSRSVLTTLYRAHLYWSPVSGGCYGGAGATPRCCTARAGPARTTTNSSASTSGGYQSSPGSRRCSERGRYADRSYLSPDQVYRSALHFSGGSGGGLPAAPAGGRRLAALVHHLAARVQPGQPVPTLRAGGGTRPVVCEGHPGQLLRGPPLQPRQARQTSLRFHLLDQLRD